MKQIIATIGLLCVGLSGAGHETNAQVTINIFNLNDVLRAKPRLILTAEAEMEGYSPVKVTQRLIDKVEVPK